MSYLIWGKAEGNVLTRLQRLDEVLILNLEKEYGRKESSIKFCGQDEVVQKMFNLKFELSVVQGSHLKVSSSQLII